MGHSLNPAAIQQALADQIEGHLGTAGTADPTIENLQVTAEMNLYPSVPSIDIYPAEPFRTSFRMGTDDMTFFVRARVHTADHVAGQQLLLSMMGDGDASLTQAIHSDRKLNNTVGGLAVTQVGGFGLFTDAGGEGSYLGALWTVRVVP
jgi:hypothetical protein